MGLARSQQRLHSRGSITEAQIICRGATSLSGQGLCICANQSSLHPSRGPCCLVRADTNPKPQHNIYMQLGLMLATPSRLSASSAENERMTSQQ